ncbi:MAG TPA: caspase family protein [Pyrinomonadaceae bacterium]
MFKSKFLSVIFITVIVFSPLRFNGQGSQDNRQLQRESSRVSANERRIALVIGNGAYSNVPPLRNPSNDASDMGAMLRSLGFEVTSGINLSQRDMKRLIREFGQKLKDGGSGLFYYAGHGIQSRGRNYLIPIEADIQSETDVEDQSVDVSLVLGLMDEANNSLNVVILDACRNNPFARSFRSAGNGLAQVDAPTGTLIAYSTAPGRVARDGEGRNGIFTAELLKQMQVPGLSIEALLKRVRGNLKQLTNGEQVPWESSSLVGNFYFNPPNNVSDVNAKSSNGPMDRLLSDTNAPVSLEKLESQQRIYPLQTELMTRREGFSYDIIHYRIEAQLIPAQQLLRAGADVTFVPLAPTRTVTFELNGSLNVESIERDGKVLTNSIQSKVTVGAVGPSVRIDLDELIPANQPITLRFRWHGPLISAAGGPLPNKRMGYIGKEGSYLTYAARWLPFHEYSADRATADISMIVPSDIQVAGPSDEPISTQADGNTTRFRFVFRKPALIGNFIAGNYSVKNLTFGAYQISVCHTSASEKFVDRFGALVGEALQFYTREFGPPAFGTKLIIAQIDDGSLDAYSGSGIIFLSDKAFKNQTSPEILLRELAIQWWGHTVALKSFDDAWLSQGLAQWSSYAFRESTLSGTALAELRMNLAQRAGKFTGVSIALAPSSLHDQSEGYESIMFYKGAFAFRKLREAMGAEKFSSLLRLYLRQYRGRNASLSDFETLTNQVAGQNMRSFFGKWLEGTGFEP